MCDFPFSIKISLCADLLKIGMPDLNLLIRRGEIEAVSGPNGRKILVESLIRYLGKKQFLKKYPLEHEDR